MLAAGVKRGPLLDADGLPGCLFPCMGGCWAAKHAHALPLKPSPTGLADRPPPLVSLQVGAAAIEIWTMDDGYFFDNIVISNSVEEAEKVGRAGVEQV